MQISGNTILITGGGSGIGRGLAEAFHSEGNHVIIAGRRKGTLDETTAANPGMKSTVLDIENAESISRFASQMQSEFPALNVVIHNAGIMRPESIRKGATADPEAMIATNLLGPIRLTAALLPQLLRQPKATIHRFVRPCVCADGNHGYILRDQSGNSLVHPIAPLST